jgi:hypothetical protein
MFKSTAIAQDYESIEAAYESVPEEEQEEKVEKVRKTDERTRDREQRRRRRRERRGAPRSSESNGEAEEGAEKSDRHARRDAHRRRRHRRRHRHDDGATAAEQELSAGAGDPHPAPSAIGNPSLPSHSQQASELDVDGFPRLSTLCIRSGALLLLLLSSSTTLGFAACAKPSLLTRCSLLCVD